MMAATGTKGRVRKDSMMAAKTNRRIRNAK
jgi:hypothetical protein